MNPLHTLLAVLVTVLWGFTFVAIKVGLGEFPPLLFAALRFAVVAFPAVLFIPREGIPWRWIVWVGLSMGAFQYGFLYVGMESGMPTGLSSLVIQSQALFTLLFSTVILRDVPQRQQWFGVGLALAGMVAIALTRGGQSPLLSLILVLGAAASWATGNICIKLSKITNGFRLFVWMAVVPPLPLLILSVIFESGQVAALRSLTPLGIGTILYTGLISSLLCFGFWAYLIQRYSPNRVAPFSLLVPVFGLAFSAMLLGDRLNYLEILGSSLVFVGLCCTVLTPAKSNLT
ncbi:EamA family transporter [Oscillatoria sp. CS-180]|uniref:EamA family transporter n=1 Tax=Oscillatoria sp. CS-180 TaxID=3021720 RepID=UPI00232F2835|nr:EamA family transporter [Oscillatoria sp. CS-180]MDB9529531.1 EamA family transporter [Oscillatoria sp. CS-180]